MLIGLIAIFILTIWVMVKFCRIAFDMMRGE
jgi:hypothetical protein